MKSITIDVRLIDNSGIGTYIKNIVPGIIEKFPGLKFYLLIDPRRIKSYSDPKFKSSNVNFINCKSNLYSLYEQVDIYRAIPADTSIFWSPHYVIPALYNKKILVTIHDVCHLALPDSNLGLGKNLYARLMFKISTTKATKIITDSNFSKQEIIRFTGVSPEIVKVIHLGSGSKSYFNHDYLDESEINPYIVFLGNVKPNKNLLRLLKAFKILIDTIPHKLLIVGKKDGFISQDLEVFNYASKLGNRVEFTGFIEDVQLKKILRSAKALIFPSIYEGFGFPPLEAMECGCPVGASSAASIPEICGDAAIYFDPYSPEDIAEKILLLTTNQELCRNLIEKGYLKIHTYSWNITIEKTCEIIENILSTS